jgi:hypothetical protein
MGLDFNSIMSFVSDLLLNAGIGGFLFLFLFFVLPLFFAIVDLVYLCNQKYMGVGLRVFLFLIVLLSYPPHSHIILWVGISIVKSISRGCIKEYENERRSQSLGQGRRIEYFHD